MALMKIRQLTIENGDPTNGIRYVESGPSVTLEAVLKANPAATVTTYDERTVYEPVPPSDRVTHRIRS